jgi:hypothetical protein
LVAGRVVDIVVVLEDVDVVLDVVVVGPEVIAGPRTKTSTAWFVSPATRLSAADEKATVDPSEEIWNCPGPELPTSVFAGCPASLTEARRLVPVARSVTKSCQRLPETSGVTRSKEPKST